MTEANDDLVPLWELAEETSEGNDRRRDKNWLCLIKKFWRGDFALGGLTLWQDEIHVQGGEKFPNLTRADLAQAALGQERFEELGPTRAYRAMLDWNVGDYEKVREELRYYFMDRTLMRGLCVRRSEADEITKDDTILTSIRKMSKNQQNNQLGAPNSNAALKGKLASIQDAIDEPRIEAAVKELAGSNLWGIIPVLAWIATRDLRIAATAWADRATFYELNTSLPDQRAIAAGNTGADPDWPMPDATQAWAALAAAMAEGKLTALTDSVSCSRPLGPIENTALIENHAPGTAFPPVGQPGAARALRTIGQPGVALALRIIDRDGSPAIVPRGFSLRPDVGWIEWREPSFLRFRVLELWPEAHPARVTPIAAKPGPRPQPDKQQEIVSLTADEVGRQFPDLHQRHGQMIEEVLKARTKSRPSFERAGRAIKQHYPDGVPDQATEPNANLFRRVGEKLKQSGLPEVSNDTILRAAGRRK